jgi:putative ABC transport system permease protein
MKKWLDPLISAWVGVSTHKLRSSLTILGIVIGVSAVITLMSIGKGSEAAILSRIQSLGSDLLFVRSGATTSGGVRSAMGSAATLTEEDASAITAQVPNITVAVPYYSTSQQLVANNQNTRSSVIGTTPDYQTAYNFVLAQGAFFTDYDFTNGNRVVVLGSTIKDTLFKTGSPVGQTIRAGSQVLRVVGVLQSKGASMGTSTDDSVFIPLSTMQQMFAQPRTSRGENVVSQIAIKVKNEGQSAAVISEITALLRMRHQLGVGKDADFSITSIEDIASTVTDTASTLTFFLGAIAAISLLVGGIGVMNIMLVSVIERTREIGIRKALGAQERQIWSQFLFEASLLSFTGGLIGILTGYGASMLVARFSTMTTVVTLDIVGLALSVSVGIGLFFGFYPAWNASHLEPVQALRSE